MSGSTFGNNKIFIRRRAECNIVGLREALSLLRGKLTNLHMPSPAAFVLHITIFNKRRCVDTFKVRLCFTCECQEPRLCMFLFTNYFEFSIR